MSQCMDPRFEKLLYAYELGLLDEAESRELEIHLLECSQCFAQVREFEPVAGLIANDETVRQAVISAVQQADADAKPTLWASLTGMFRGRFSPRLIPASALFVILLVILILRPWHFEISPTEEAVAEQPRLAIMYFENVIDKSDPDRLGEIATNLLITALSEAQCVRVVSAERLDDVMSGLGLRGEEQIDKSTASRIANKVGAKWLLMGKILRTVPQLAVTTQIVDAKSGLVESSELIEGKPGEDVFALADTLARHLVKHLSLATNVCEDQGRPVADITTHSYDAYRWYLEGVDYYYMKYNDSSSYCFHKALEYDSMFAMAYYYLAKTVSSSYIKNAVQYAKNAGYKEQLYIMSLKAQFGGDDSVYARTLQTILDRFPDEKEACLLLGMRASGLDSLEQAVGYFRQAVAIDPRYKDAYNQLAYVYDLRGMFDSAMLAIDQYITVAAPDEPNPYDSRGDIFAYNGKLDSAIDCYQKALKMYPGFTASETKLGCLYTFRGDFALAETHFRHLTTSTNPTAARGGQSDLINCLLYQGRCRDALRTCDSVFAPSSESGKSQKSDKFDQTGTFMRTEVYIAAGDRASAIRLIDSILAAGDSIAPVWTYPSYARQLAVCGEFDRAEKLIKQAEEFYTKNNFGLYGYWHSMGVLEVARGNGPAAVDYFTKALTTMGKRTGFFDRYMLGRAYLQAGRVSDAVTQLESLVPVYTAERLDISFHAILLHYYLGLAYEQSGQKDKAADQYAMVANVWKNADCRIPELDDAIARLGALRPEAR